MDSGKHFWKKDISREPIERIQVPLSFTLTFNYTLKSENTKNNSRKHQKKPWLHPLSWKVNYLII